MKRPFILVLTGLVVGALCLAPLAVADSFTTSYLDGGSWSTLYAQGFSPSVEPSPDLGLSAGTMVELNSFEFFKSGSPDSAIDIRLAITNGLYPNLDGLNVSSSAVVGLSDNTVAGTAGLATGDPIVFSFSGLNLDYGGNYGAIFVNVGGSGELTPVQVSALRANYIDDGSGTFVPETNYGGDNNFDYATTNFFATNEFGTFFTAFDFAADANFRASFTVIPEPSTAVLLAVSGVLLGCYRRCS